MILSSQILIIYRYKNTKLIHIYWKKRCQKSVKFNEQSEKDMFVKYKEFNIFRIWLFNKEKIVWRWNVVFDENLIQNNKFTVIQSSVFTSLSKQIC